VRRWSYIVFALVLAALPLGCSSDEPPPPPARVPAAPPPEPRAQLKGLKGDVKVKRAAGDEWVSAKEGMPLFENDKVRTVSGASAQLVFANGSTVNVGADALVGIAETRPRPGLERADLTVLRGRVDAELDAPARQSLSVTTPAATVRAGREIVFQ
jgi:hypothetical protein